MSKEIKLEVGQWYRDLYGNILKCVYICRREKDSVPCLLELVDGGNVWYGLYPHDLTHLPDCTGFDWEPPKPVEPPEGWRLLSIGETIEIGDLYLRANEWVAFEKADSTTVVNDDFNPEIHRPIARKIGAMYRQFANADEFKPHWARLLKYIRNNKNHYMSIDAFNDECVFLSGDSDNHSYEYLLENYVFADTGKPAGVEVTE